MIKLIGGALIMIFSAGAASYIVSCEKKKIEEIEGFIALLRYIRNQIDCFSVPMETILSSCPEILSKLGVDETTTSFSELISKCDMTSGEECKKIIREFALSLGKGYREQELKKCDKAIGELENIKNRMVASYPSKKKTTSALCLAIGGALLIALL